MAKLIYSAITSLDGFVEDAKGTFDWAAPSEEVHAFLNDLERPVGTYLYGRRMYETMVYWDRPPSPDQSAVAQDYAAIWQAADKVVYSTTLAEVTSARTRIEREFDPAVIRRLKEAADRDVTVGGAALAARAIDADLVDEYQLFLVPVLIGAGKRAFPERAPGQRLELLDKHSFGDGTVYLHYSRR